MMIQYVYGLSVGKLNAKQIVTIGPKSNTLEQFKEMNKVGANIFRINLSHSSRLNAMEYSELLNSMKRQSRDELEIMADLQGVKFRIGEMEDNVVLKKNQEIRLDRRNEKGDKFRIPFPHSEVYSNISPGSILLLNDGKIKLEVIRQSNLCLITKVKRGGELNSFKGVNIPYLQLKNCKIPEKDMKDLQLINNCNIDIICLSFINTVEDIDRIKKIITNKCKIFVKIETALAVDNLDEIIDNCDGIIVARGDLALEVDYTQTPFIQKIAIKKARTKGKEVIVATEMLESMIINETPTRAEICDVANAILDGATGVMLSAETAMGNNPIRAIEVQREIIETAEKYINEDEDLVCCVF